MLKLLALGHVLLGKAAVAVGARPKPDGWRRIVGVGLRAEHAKFALTAFGLTPPADPPAALARFLRADADTRFALTHAPRLVTRHRTDAVDVAELSFAPDGSLTGVSLHLDPRLPEPTAAERERGVVDVIAAYNRTRTLPETARPLELERAVGDDPFARRLLAAACVSFDDTADRFAPPDFRTRRGFGRHFLTFVLRRHEGTRDVWAVAHHTAIDGVPLQEMLTRLERAWGVEEARFPTPHERADEPRTCHLPGEREVWESLSFHDFSGLLAVRKRVNAEHGLNVPVAALLLWLLSREAEFDGVKFSSTVDVPATGTSERDVDLIPLRPADFADLPAYARAFAAGIEAARSRSSKVRKAMCDTELLPPKMQRELFEGDPKGVGDTFGSVGLSVIKDAKVFVAPLADVGFPGGFVAVGSAELPTTDGGRATAVWVKGTKEQAATYPAVFRRMLAKLRTPAAVG